jgi:hypothetical protein
MEDKLDEIDLMATQLLLNLNENNVDEAYEKKYNEVCDILDDIGTLRQNLRNLQIAIDTTKEQLEEI